MIAITPIGTRTCEISRPLGRRHFAITSPTGSGRAATSSTPRAIASIRASLSVSRSTNAPAMPAARARSRSAVLADMIAPRCSRSIEASLSSAWFFRALGHKASARAASRASLSASRVSVSRLTSTARARGSCQFFDQCKVVAMDNFVGDLVAERARYIDRTPALHFQYIGGGIIDQPAAELDAFMIEQADAVAAFEFA